MMTSTEFLALVALLPYVRVMTSTTCITCYFDPYYDWNHDLSDSDQERFDQLYHLIMEEGVKLTDTQIFFVDSPDGSDSWAD